MSVEITITKVHEGRAGHWQLKKNRKGWYYLALVASNGRTLFHTESFETKDKAKSKIVAGKTISTIKRQVFLAENVVVDDVE